MKAKIPYKWPLALDLLKRQYDANKRKTLLFSQTPFFDELGPNVEYTLFGTEGFLTFDPENLEAVLSTNFEGLYTNSKRRAPKRLMTNFSYRLLPRIS